MSTCLRSSVDFEEETFGGSELCGARVNRLTRESRGNRGSSGRISFAEEKRCASRYCLPRTEGAAAMMTEVKCEMIGAPLETPCSSFGSLHVLIPKVWTPGIRLSSLGSANHGTGPRITNSRACKPIRLFGLDKSRRRASTHRDGEQLMYTPLYICGAHISSHARQVPPMRMNASRYCTRSQTVIRESCL